MSDASGPNSGAGEDARLAGDRDALAVAITRALFLDALAPYSDEHVRENSETYRTVRAVLDR